MPYKASWETGNRSRTFPFHRKGHEGEVRDSREEAQRDIPANAKVAIILKESHGVNAGKFFLDLPIIK